MDERLQPSDRGLDDRVPFLARLEHQERTALLGLGHALRYAPRSEVLHQGEPSTHVLLLLDGWTKVTAAAANGYEALLALRGPGDIVGESAAVSGRSRSATVTSMEAVSAVAINRETFTTHLRDTPAVALQLLALTSDRMRAADQRRLEFAALSVRERLAILLLDLARTHGKRTAEGIELTISLSKHELAGSIGASREAVTRLLSELRRRNAVSTGRRSLVLVRPDVLRAISRPG